MRRLLARNDKLQTGDLAAQVLFNFELGNQVYAKARVKPTTKANLWLGADVMLEYPLDEATQLLVHSLVVACFQQPLLVLSCH